MRRLSRNHEIWKTQEKSKFLINRDWKSPEPWPVARTGLIQDKR